MSGQQNGMQSIVSQLLGREVPYIKCQGHRSNTINEHACAASPIVADLLNTLCGILHVTFVLNGSCDLFLLLVNVRLERK